MWGGPVWCMPLVPLHLDEATACEKMTTQQTEGRMLWIFFCVLVVLWIVGLIKEPMGGFVHFLLLLALVAAGTELALLWRRRNEKQQSAFSTQQSAPLTRQALFIEPETCAGTRTNSHAPAGQVPGEPTRMPSRDRSGD
jgi:hypothetical protein